MQKGRVYALDADVKGYAKDVHDLRTWIQALEQEAILARRGDALTLGTAGGTSSSVSPEKRLPSRQARVITPSPHASCTSIGSSSMSGFSSPLRCGSAMGGSQSSHRSMLYSHMVRPEDGLLK